MQEINHLLLNEMKFSITRKLVHTNKSIELIELTVAEWLAALFPKFSCMHGLTIWHISRIGYQLCGGCDACRWITLMEVCTYEREKTHKDGSIIMDVRAGEGETHECDEMTHQKHTCECTKG
jgi:hypothetical protein